MLRTYGAVGLRGVGEPRSWRGRCGRSGWADVEDLGVKPASGWCRGPRRYTRSWRGRARPSEVPGSSRDPLIHPDPSQPHPRARKLERFRDPTPSVSRQLSSSPCRAKPSTRLKKRNEKRRVTYRLKSLCPLVSASLTALPRGAAVAGLAAGDVGVIRGVLLGHRETISLPSTGGSGKKKKR